MLSVEQLIFYVIIGLVITRYLIGVLQDLQRSLSLASFTTNLRRRAKNKGTPRVTMVLVTHNAENTVVNSIRDTLQVSEKLKNTSILVADNGSSDNTVKLARKFAKHPNVDVYAKQTRTNKTQDILKEIRGRAKGSVLVILPEGVNVRTELIRRTQDVFAAHPSLSVAHGSLWQTNPLSNSMVLTVFNTLSRYRYSRLFDGVHSDSFMIVRRRFINTKGELKQKENNLRIPSDFLFACSSRPVESDSVTTSSHKTDIQSNRNMRALTMFNTAVYIFEPFVYAYAVWLALSAGVISPMVISWILISGVYAYALLTSSVYTVAHKLRLSPYLPVLFLLVIVYGAFIIPAQFITRHLRSFWSLQKKSESLS